MEMKKIEKIVVSAYKHSINDIIKERKRTKNVAPSFDMMLLKGLAGRIMQDILILEDDSVDRETQMKAMLNAKNVILQFSHIKRRNSNIIPAWMQERLYWLVRVLSKAEAKRIVELEREGLKFTDWDVHVILFKEENYREVLKNKGIKKVVRKGLENKSTKVRE